MSERHHVIDLFTRHPLGSPEHHSALIQELADLDMECEPTDRRREEIRRQLGLLAAERGLNE